MCSLTKKIFLPNCCWIQDRYLFSGVIFLPLLSNLSKCTWTYRHARVFRGRKKIMPDSPNSWIKYVPCAWALNCQQLAFHFSLWQNGDQQRKIQLQSAFPLFELAPDILQTRLLKMFEDECISTNGVCHLPWSKHRVLEFAVILCF